MYWKFQLCPFHVRLKLVQSIMVFMVSSYVATCGSYIFLKIVHMLG